MTRPLHFFVSLALASACSPPPPPPSDAPRSDGALDDVVDAASDDVTPPDDAPADAPPDEPPPASGVGTPCTGGGVELMRGTCALGQRCLEAAYGYEGGYCTRTCNASACPADSVCVSFVSGARLCMRRCGSTADCRADEGYTCTRITTTARACMPLEAPVGSRGADEQPCFSATPGAPNALAPLARRVFASPNVGVTRARTDVAAGRDVTLARSPRSSAVALSYVALQGTTFFSGASASTDGATFAHGTAAADAGRQVEGARVAYRRDGALHLARINNRVVASGTDDGRAELLTSADDGRTWGEPRVVFTPAQCPQCVSAMLAVGPAPDAPERDNVYVFATAQPIAGGAQVMFARSEDNGATFSAPTEAVGVWREGAFAFGPAEVTAVVGPDGVLHVVFASQQLVSVLGPRWWGDPTDRVYYTRSSDGGRTWSTPQRVSRPSDVVIRRRPAIAVDGAAVHIAYVAGPADGPWERGAWDIILATRPSDAAPFAHRRVNDEPESCASHTTPALAVDTTRHAAHVLWLENRFGDGMTAYAECPGDPARACGTNEQVNDAPFAYSNTRDATRTIGNEQSLALDASGELWAGWSDTRDGAPTVLMARGRPR